MSVKRGVCGVRTLRTTESKLSAGMKQEWTELALLDETLEIKALAVLELFGRDLFPFDFPVLHSFVLSR